MWIFYLLSLIPLAIGAIIWYKREDVVLWEWLAGFGVALLMSIIFHVCAFTGMTHDSETWSGEITHVIHYPRWVEQYQQAHTRTVGSGKNQRTETYYTTEYRTHSEHWKAYTNIDSERTIDEDFYEQARSRFGGNVEKKWEFKSGFYSGDHHIYIVRNQTGYVYAINEHRSFENRIQAAPSLWSFPQPPKDTKIFDYPVNERWLASDRLLGAAGQNIDLISFDRMNSRLGPSKKVNVIVIGFPAGSSEMLGQYQQAKWIGGKKNDLVICYGGGNATTKPEWVYVFGWTEKELVKQNLQSYLLERPINNDVIPVIENEIRKTYDIKDWSKFDYISIEPPTWSYWVYLIVMILTQGGFYIWAIGNEHQKL